MNIACPCCGRPIANADDSLRWNPVTRTLAGRGTFTEMTVVEAAMFDVLWTSRPTGKRVGSQEIASQSYGHCGGPLSVRVRVCETLQRVGDLLAPFGLSIDTSRGRCGGYRLVDHRAERQAA